MSRWLSSLLLALAILSAAGLAGCTGGGQAHPLERVVSLGGSVPKATVEFQPAGSGAQELAALRRIAPNLEDQLADGAQATLLVQSDAGAPLGRAAIVVKSAVRHGERFDLYGVLYYRDLQAGPDRSSGSSVFRIVSTVEGDQVFVDRVEVPADGDGVGPATDATEFQSLGEEVFSFSQEDEERLLRQ